MSRACARSWGVVGSWSYCTLDRGHDGICSCAGKDKLPDALWWEDQPEAAAANAKEVELERRERAKKGLG